jgi:hypothetical protein
MTQRVDLYQPMVAAHDSAPLAIRVGVPNNNSMSEGVPSGGQVRAEMYVLLSALPDELRRRVELAVQALLAGR